MPSIINRSQITTTGNTGGLKIISDVSPLEIIKPPVLTEGIAGKKVLRCTGRWQHGNKLNANGRWYGTDILKEAVEQIQPDIKARGVLGEFDHPPDAKIHLNAVSHVITKLWLEGNEVYGELEVLEELPYGKQLAGLLRSNVRVGISSRGVGDMESAFMEGTEVMKVLPGYSLLTFDVVAEPSVGGSYIHLMESKNRIQNDKRIIEKKLINEVKKTYFVK